MTTEIMNSRPCIIRGCSQPGVCRDDKYDTKSLAEEGSIEVDATIKEWWLCNEHAVEFLFPIIDAACGNTFDGIMKDFRKEGMLG